MKNYFDETIERTEYFPCNCGTELIALTAWICNDEVDPEIFLSLFQRGAKERFGSWSWRLRHIWHILTKGTPFLDDVILNPDEAKRLAATLIAMGTLKRKEFPVLTKEELDRRVKSIEDGTAKYVSQEDVTKNMGAIIKKHQIIESGHCYYCGNRELTYHCKICKAEYEFRDLTSEDARSAIDSYVEDAEDAK